MGCVIREREEAGVREFFTQHWISLFPGHFPATNFPPLHDTWDLSKHVPPFKHEVWTQHFTFAGSLGQAPVTKKPSLLRYDAVRCFRGGEYLPLHEPDVNLHVPEPAVDLQAPLILPRARGRRLVSKTVVMREVFMVDSKDCFSYFAFEKSKKGGQVQFGLSWDWNWSRLFVNDGRIWWERRLLYQKDNNRHFNEYGLEGGSPSPW